jgi:predicted nuclease with TOPRIM domain
MMEDMNMSFEERMKERKRIITMIDEIKSKIEELKNKIAQLEEELKNCGTTKLNLEKKVNDLKEEYIQKGIPVPSDGNFEILNGLLGAKRDVNLKLISGLRDEKLRQVFF